MFEKVFAVIDTTSSVDFSELVDVVITFLSDAKMARPLQIRIEEYSQKHKLNLNDVLGDVKSLILAATDGIKNHQTSSQLQNELVKTGLSDEKVEMFVKKWQENYGNISHAILSQTLTVNKLVNMEWKFGVTAASSDSASVGKTFLQLKLVVKKADRFENIFMELTLPQFYTFLHEMERARACMELFS